MVLSSDTTNSVSSNSSTPRLTVESLLNLLSDKVQFVPFTVDHDNFEESSSALLELVFPHWPLTQLKLTQCTDGITNKLMKCKNLATGQVVLIRAYGKKSELIIDRQTELITFAALQQDGLAPPLYCRFENGIIYGYIPGIPLKPNQMTDPVFFPLIARKMAQWHQVDTVPGIKTPRLFKTLWKWFKNIPNHYGSDTVDATFRKHINVDYLKKELNLIEFVARGMDSPVVFCHNDLLSANLIFNPGTNEISFIDYEYGSFNYRGFDIANHFCEFAGFDCDYSQYPSIKFQKQWIQEYLSYFNKSADGSTSHVSEEQVQFVLDEVAIFTLAAHFFWGLWALAQAHFSDIPFDYMGYAVKRFTEYDKRKFILNTFV